METLIKLFFFASLIFSIFEKGLCQPCVLSNITISQTAAGEIITGAPEYQVEVTNQCVCSQTAVKVQCGGFNTIEKVDPAVFRQDGQKCNVNDGQPIYFGAMIKFKHAWETQAELVPISSQINCS